MADSADVFLEESLWCTEDLQFDDDGVPEFAESGKRIMTCDSCSAIDAQDDPQELCVLLGECLRKEAEFMQGFLEYGWLLGGLFGSAFELRRLRKAAVVLIVKMCRSFNFSAATTSLAVNYLDRYLSKNCWQKQWRPWMVEMVSVGCVSIAAKMEEVYVPALADFQMEGIGHVFTSLATQRMELSILDALSWRMNAVTVFSYIDPVTKILNLETCKTSVIVSRVSELLLAAICEVEFVEFRPSTIFLSAMLCALHESLPLKAFSYACQLLELLQINQDELNRCSKCMEEIIEGPCSPSATPMNSKTPLSPSTVLLELYHGDNLGQGLPSQGCL